MTTPYGDTPVTPYTSYKDVPQQYAPDGVNQPNGRETSERTNTAGISVGTSTPTWPSGPSRESYGDVAAAEAVMPAQPAGHPATPVSPVAPTPQPFHGNLPGRLDPTADSLDAAAAQVREAMGHNNTGTGRV